MIETELRTRISEAAKVYRETLAAYRKNLSDHAVLEAWDAATAVFSELIRGNEETIIASLFEELEARPEQKPVGWTDEQELRDVEKDGCGYFFKANPITPNADLRRVIKLYREPMPASRITVTVKLPDVLGWRPPSRREVVLLDDVILMLGEAGIKINPSK